MIEIEVFEIFQPFVLEFLKVLFDTLIQACKREGEERGRERSPLPFPGKGREGNQPQGEEGEGKIQGDPLYSPQKIRKK